jgi:hypothetical protein
MINAFLSLFIIINSFTHEHYTSISTINFNSKKNIELVIEFTAHDLEYHFEKEHNVLLKLGSPNEFKASDSLITNYISNHFNIILNSSPVKLDFIGKEINNDESMLLYFEKKNFKKIKSLEIFNDLLCKYYPTQQNIVHLDGVLKNSFIFSSKQTNYKFK